MAPFLMAHDEREECFTPTPIPIQVKRIKPVVPAIPRALERRPKKDIVPTSKTSDISTHPVEPDPVEPQANSSEKTSVPDNGSEYRGFSFLVEEQEPEIDLRTLKIEGDESIGQSPSCSTLWASSITNTSPSSSTAKPTVLQLAKLHLPNLVRRILGLRGMGFSCLLHFIQHTRGPPCSQRLS